MTVSREPHPVLIVEDTAGCRKIAIEACEALKLAPVAVASFKEAIALLEANPRRFCLVLLDLKIPFDDEAPRPQIGLNLLARIRELVERGVLPVIVMTAEVAQKYIKKAMQLGANDYANKPFGDDDEAVEDRIMRWIHQGCEQRNKKTGCPNVEQKAPRATRKPKGDLPLPGPAPGQPRLRLVGTMTNGLFRLIVNDEAEGDIQEVPFRALVQLAVGLKTRQMVSKERIRSGYNAISRLKKELHKKCGVPEAVAKKLVVPDGVGYYRLTLPVDHVNFDDTMGKHFRLHLEAVRAAEAVASPQ